MCNTYILLILHDMNKRIYIKFINKINSVTKTILNKTMKAQLLY